MDRVEVVGNLDSLATSARTAKLEGASILIDYIARTIEMGCEIHIISVLKWATLFAKKNVAERN